jgi:hypothetical protein
LPWLPRRIAPVAPAISILEPPLPNLLGFIAADDKEFQASQARDTRIRFCRNDPQVTPQRRVRRDVLGRAFAACVIRDMHIRVSATMCS